MDTSMETSNTEIPENAQVATLAGGCFWCIESQFDNLDGVFQAVSGYAGGTEENATYNKVSSGTTDHFEAVQIHYDPEVLTFNEVLDIFFRSIDPTDEGGQFADRGPQYRTAIFYHNEEQKQQAESYIKELEPKFEKPIATKILPHTTFFPAEEEHQNYAQKRLEQYKNYYEGSGRKDYVEETWGQ